MRESEHLPDYAKFIAQPVEAEAHDIVIVACQCGDESCTWQLLVHAKDMTRFAS